MGDRIMSDNFSKTVLELMRRKNYASRKRAAISMLALKDKGSDYYEHHQHMVNTYERIIDILDHAIKSSENIGKDI